MAIGREKSSIKLEYVKSLLKLLTREEFKKFVDARDRLKAFGILRDDGTIDYGLGLEVLAIAKNDGHLKNAILRFVVQVFPGRSREDVWGSGTGRIIESLRTISSYIREIFL